MRFLLLLILVLCFLGSCHALSMKMRTHLLEVQNTVRGFVAAGNLSGLGLLYSAPPAADLRAFGWMHRLAKHAEDIQKRMCERKEVEEAWKPTVMPDFFVASQRTVVGAANATIGTLLSKITALGPTLKDFKRQPLVLADYVRLGCAMLHCDGQKLLTCVYGSERNVQPSSFERPYTPGQPCSRCPPGNNFCMNGLLCVTLDQCKLTKSRCTCLIQKEKCTAAGGQYDALNCRCTCGVDQKRSGLYCNTPCKDNGCRLKLSEEEKMKKKKRPAKCFDGKLAQRLILVSTCRLTCNFCREDAFIKIDVEEKEEVPVQMFAKLRYAQFE